MNTKEYNKEYFKRYYQLHKEKIKKRSLIHHHKTKNPEKRHVYYLQHKKHIIEKSRLYRNINKGELSQKNKVWRNTLSPQRIKEMKRYYKEYRIKNKDKINEKCRLRRKNDLQYKISHNLRKRVGDFLRGLSKSKKTMELLGCSFQDFKIHIEKQFKEGMSWENYGPNGWHMDHILPCASFDLSKPEEQAKCFHYTNLQPLWAIDNYKKSDNILT